MYLHLGQDTLVKKKDIVGIFDMENTTVSKRTLNFLKISEKKKQVINVSYEMPKTFIVCATKKERKVYISQISSSTLLKRSGISKKL